jgi:hypothetical protein
MRALDLYTCPHCNCPMHIVFVKFAFSGVATIAACPSCALTAVDEPEPMWPRSRTPARRSNCVPDAALQSKPLASITVPMRPKQRAFQKNQIDRIRRKQHLKQGATLRACLTCLLAVGIFVAAGYMGLVWLADPSRTGHLAAMRPQHAGTSSNEKRSEAAGAAPERSSNSSAAPGESLATREDNQNATRSARTREAQGVEESKPAGIPSSAVQQGDESHQPKTSVSSSDPSLATKPDGVPAASCMPIGMTAQGDLVFPLQCRELRHRELGPDPAIGAGPPKQALDHAIQTVGSLRDQETVDSRARGSELSSGLDPASGKLEPESSVSRSVGENSNGPAKVWRSSQTLNDRHRPERYSARRSRMITLHSAEWDSPLTLRCLECLIFGYR